MRKKAGEFIMALLAGIMIGIGGTVYLSCENKVAGAFLFTVGLITICEFGFYLFTGKVAYTLVGSMKWSSKISFLAIVILGNYIGTMLYGLAVGIAKPSIKAAAAGLCVKKLAQKPPVVLVLSICCGILMYIAVDGYRRNVGSAAKYVGILVCIPTFILCGFEHSIADMAYFALAADFRLETYGFLAVVLIGNAAGSILIPLCEKMRPET